MLRRAVQQNVEVRADVHMAGLQGACEREHERNVLLLLGLFTNIFQVRWRTGGKAAGERGVGVDVELEEMEEGIGHHADCAVYLGLDAVVKLEGLFRLVALGEGDPFDLVVVRVLDVFARFTAAKRTMFVSKCLL